MNTSKVYSDSRGDFSYVITPSLGPCTTCGEKTSIFINRDGKTLCVGCDVEEGKRWEAERFAREVPA